MKMKKFILLMIAMALIVSLCGCKAAKDGEEADSEPSSSATDAEAEPEPVSKTAPEYHFTDAVQERGVLTIGVSTNSKMNYIIPNDPEKYGELAGTRGGYIPALCRRIAEELGVEVEYVEYESVEAQLQAVTDGDIDFAAENFVINEERLALYEMTDSFDVIGIEGDDVFLSTNPQPWLSPEEETGGEPEPREMIQTEEELAHARIAAVKDTVQARNITKQYPEAEVHQMDNNEAVLEAVVTGQVDAGVFSMFDRAFADQIMQDINEGTVAQCSYEIVTADYLGNGLILMKGNEELCQSINEIISVLKESGWLLETYKTEEQLAIERGIA